MPDIDNKYIERLEAENHRLRRAVNELSVLNELAREIGALVNSQEIMRRGISRSLRAVHAEQGTMTLVGSESTTSAKTLVHSTAPHKFATFFYGPLEAETHRFGYSNAGHDPPLFYSTRTNRGSTGRGRRCAQFRS